MESRLGNYSNNLQKRFSNRGQEIGLCTICRQHVTLTRDHVPPKACGNISDVVIRDVYGNSLKQQRKPLVSQGGLHFKTICDSCNTKLLGTDYDPALIALVREIGEYLTRVSESRLILSNTQMFEYQPNRFLRSVLGHLLAANAVSETENTTTISPLDAALRAYVLNPSEVLPESIHVYYWLYPYRNKVIMKHCVMGFADSSGDSIYGHLFKFFPFGFWVVWNDRVNKGVQRINLPRLGLDTSSDISATARLPICLLPLQASNFPELPSDTANWFWMLADHLVSQAETRIK